jgi:iron-sulfur cluster repair protein YtfE (RIC family)
MKLTGIAPADTNRKPSRASSPVEMLLDCHVRIRHFLQLSRTLANAGEAPAAEIVEAAGAVRRYFIQALPLHEADEEQTLLPRLQAALESGNPVLEAAFLMAEHHRAVEELVPELLSLCETLEQRPVRLTALAEKLRRINQAMGQYLEAHLELEERVIFPAVAKLPAAVQDEMRREMLERRRAQSDGPRREPPAAGGIHLVR